VSVVEIRCWRPADDPGLVGILRAQLVNDPAWPPAYAHRLDLGDWLGGPADLGRWVAVDGRQVVGHIGLGNVSGSVAEEFSRATGHRADGLAELCRTVVDPHARGNGIASALTRKALKTALIMRRIPVATVLTGRGSWLQMMKDTGWRPVADIEASGSSERLILLLAPERFIDTPLSNGR